MIVAACAVTKDAVGKSVAQWGRNHGYEAFEAFFALLLQNRGEVGAMFEEIGEEDMRRILQDSRVMIGSDGAIDKLSDGGHPRTFGTFPRAIALFTRDEKLVPLEEMIRHMTSRRQRPFRLKEKGFLPMEWMLISPSLIRKRYGIRRRFWSRSRSARALTLYWQAEKLYFVMVP